MRILYRDPLLKATYSPQRYTVGVNPGRVGTKACFHFADRMVPAGQSILIQLRLTDTVLTQPLADVDAVVAERRAEADEFYASIHPAKATEDERRIQRQALVRNRGGKTHFEVLDDDAKAL
jgi:hypothetical protein